MSDQEIAQQRQTGEFKPTAPTGTGLLDTAPRSRRALLAAGTGLIGAAFSAAFSDPVSARASTMLADEGPFTLDDQRLLMALMMRIELSTRDLYDAGLEAGASPEVAGSMSRQHRAYADAISGAIGASARGRNEAFYDRLRPAFATSDTAALARAASELEAKLAATYTQVVGIVEDLNWVNVVASIAPMEARHAVVLGSIAGENLVSLIDLEPAALTAEELA